MGRIDNGDVGDKMLEVVRSGGSDSHPNGRLISYVDSRRRWLAPTVSAFSLLSPTLNMMAIDVERIHYREIDNSIVFGRCFGPLLQHCIFSSCHS